MIPKMKDPGIAPLALTMHGKTVLLSPACLTMSCTCLTMSCEERFLFYCSKGIDVVCHRAKRSGINIYQFQSHHLLDSSRNFGLVISGFDALRMFQHLKAIVTPANSWYKRWGPMAGLDGNMPKIAHAIIGPINDALVIPRGMRVIPRTQRLLRLLRYKPRPPSPSLA